MNDKALLMIFMLGVGIALALFSLWYDRKHKNGNSK
jgi:hypothetical protein